MGWSLESPCIRPRQAHGKEILLSSFREAFSCLSGADGEHFGGRVVHKYLSKSLVDIQNAEGCINLGVSCRQLSWLI